MSELLRRTALKLGAVLALTSHTPAVAAQEAQQQPMSVDEFLSKATASERAWYHAVALAEAMNDLDPTREYFARVNCRLGFAEAYGRKIEVLS